MALLNEEIFVCLDCETTGLDPEQDRIIEFALVRFTFTQILNQFESLINPERTISDASFEIHKINAEMLKDKPTIETLLPTIFEIIGSDIIMGHGIQFDVQLLINAAKRASIPCSLQKNRLIDTLRLARLYGESPGNSLLLLGKHFNVPSDGAHRAMNDVTTNIEVFKHLAKRFTKTEEVFEQLARPIRMKTMPLGKHKGRLFSEIPLHYLLKAATMDYDQDLLFSIRSELKKRKQGGLFSQAANPFFEL